MIRENIVRIIFKQLSEKRKEKNYDEYINTCKNI